MGVAAKVTNAVNVYRRQGFRRTLHYTALRCRESYYEWAFGIDTAGRRGQSELGIDCPYAMHYYPSDYGSIFKALRHVDVQRDDVFIDFGAGMGRVMVVAATYPFRRIIGVELSQELSEIAKLNIGRARRKIVCGDVQVVNEDATTFEVPTDASVMFLYNPFHGPVLSQVINNLRLSLKQHPRRMQVVFKNTPYFEPLLGGERWLQVRRRFKAFDADHSVMILEADSRMC